MLHKLLTIYNSRVNKTSWSFSGAICVKYPQQASSQQWVIWKGQLLPLSPAFLRPVSLAFRLSVAHSGVSEMTEHTMSSMKISDNRQEKEI